MTKRVTTESGAVYEFDDHNNVRRVNESHRKRGDGEWQELYDMTPIGIGKRMVLRLNSLAIYGRDDKGTPLDEVSEVTTRTTTPVRSIDEV